MKVIRLTAENVKRLKAVEITPEGPVQVVTGRNAQGKTSVLDAIWLALGGGAAGRGTATTRPIRDGEDEALATVDLGDLIVERRWTEKGTTLKVKAADGAAHQRPQEMLDELVGRLSFDPLSFIQLDDRAQVAQLLELVDLPFDLEALDAQRAQLYERRHAQGQERTRAKGAFETMDRPEPDLPVAEESSSAVLAEYETAQAALRHNEARRRELTDAQTLADQASDAVADAEAALTAAKDKYELAQRALDVAQTNVDDLPPDPDLQPFRDRLSALEELNAKVRAAGDWRAAKAEYEAADETWKALSEEIDALDAKKTTGLAKAKFPVKGLGFDEGGVTYNGVPFRQASSAEQLRVSLGMAMALNPQLRVILIRDGSLLDEANMALIEEMAAKQDFQVWIERVEDSRKAAVIIEDGKVAK